MAEVKSYNDLLNEMKELQNTLGMAIRACGGEIIINRKHLESTVDYELSLTEREDGSVVLTALADGESLPL